MGNFVRFVCFDTQHIILIVWRMKEMNSILFNETPIEKLDVWNTPSYVQQNIYGNMKYYPVVEPIDIITKSDINDAYIEQAKKYESTDKLVEDFFKWNPRTTGGKLSDSKLIRFLGFRYKYHPNHKTYYGNVDEEYLLLPIIARWMLCINASTANDDFDEAHRFPREYRGGCSRGYKLTLNKALNKQSEIKGSDVKAEMLIPMLPTGSIARNIALMNIDTCLFVQLDSCLMSLGINPSTALTGSKSSDVIQTVGDKDFVASVNRDLAVELGMTKVAEDGLVKLYSADHNTVSISALLG